MTIDLGMSFHGTAYKSYQNVVDVPSIAPVNPINLQSYGGCEDCVDEPISDLAPCQEPLLYGANILTDPQFEYQANWGLGPGGNELPDLDNATGKLVWSDSSEAPYAGWYVYTSGHWTISTVSPRLNSYHARSAGATFGNTPFIHVGNTKLCFTPADDFLWRPTARVQPGDQFTLAGYGKFTSGTGTIRVNVDGVDALGNYNFALSSNSQTSAGTTYTAFVLTGVVPTGVSYIDMVIRGDSVADGVRLDLDQMSLALVAG